MAETSHAASVADLLRRLVPPQDTERLIEDPGFFAGGGPTGEASAAEMHRAQGAVETLRSGGALDARAAAAVEAIILPRLRPVVDIRQGDFVLDDPLWAHLAQGDAAGHLRRAIPAVGRVEMPGHATIPYAGTGFVVGEGLMMTNRHVAELFARGLGRAGLEFRPGLRAAVNPAREAGGDPQAEDALTLAVRRVRMIHPWWDMALLEVEGLEPITPLELSLEPPPATEGRDIAVIGYPALDTRNDIDLQLRIFRRLFQVKRLQPGKVTGQAATDSFGNRVMAATHDASTLGGNSGSAVICAQTGRVLGLHFAGRYLETNFAVPAAELARDRHVRAAGVRFAGGAADATTGWDAAWAAADGESPAQSTVAQAGTVPVATVQVGGGTVVATIPVTLTLAIGLPSVTVAAAVSAAPVERMRAPLLDPDYAARPGYDAGFLGLDVPMPVLSDPGVSPPRLDGSDSPVLAYHHFSILMHRDRRLALCTAANVDGSAKARRPEPFRDYDRKAVAGLDENDTELWVTDPRIAARHQLPDVYYRKDRQSFDKGHVVRREDVAFGDSYDALRRANNDTFHCTNCSPQVAGFNRHGIWRRLEDAVKRQGSAERYCIFAGPVFREDDPWFDGVDDDGPVRVQIPLRYWKLIVCVEDGRLAAHGFVLKQDLGGVAFSGREFAVPAALAEHLVPLDQLQGRLPALILPDALHDADRFASPATAALRRGMGETETLDWALWD
ncbi:DNA/RNA non-specific endonuclease [Paracoccaceae bacterium Fryx2]|nr:DNA/RNA non-specific endonuclease [Paracoccaceae bacterium Fryx2]